MPIFQGYFSYAPFPEGFQGDMDETFQQSGQLAIIYINGNFLTGEYVPPGTTLPTSDQGPIAMGGVWYFWDTTTGQYLPQSTSVKTARNYAKNAIYQIQQTGNAFTLGSGITRAFDMTQPRVTGGGVLSIAADTGPPATADNDFCLTSIKYTVGPGLDASLAATDLYVHEHLVEGSDITSIQGETLSLSFSVWCNQAGTYSAYLTNFNRDMSYVFSFPVVTASQWARIKIPNIPAMPTGTGTWSFSEGTTGLYLGVGLGVGAQYLTSTPNKWVAGFFAGTAANTNLLTVVNNQMKISGVKLEASPAVTYLVANSFEADLHDAIRYYWTSYNYQSLTTGIPALMLNAFSAGFAGGSMLFPRRMCKIPTVALFSPNTNTTATLRNLTTNVDVTAFAAPNVSAKGIYTAGAITTPASAKSDVLAAMVTADARLS